MTSSARYVGANGSHAQQVLDLGVGQISGPGPDQLDGILKHALEPPFNAYSPPAGVPGVRTAVARALGVKQGGEAVVMTTGASGAFLSFLLLSIGVRQRPRLAVPDPCYPAFLGTCRRLGIATDVYRVEGRRIDLDTFRGALTPDTIGAVVITPGNPDGIVLHPDDIQQAELLAAEHDVALVLDQSYAELAPSAMSQATLMLLHERSAQLRSFSKPYALSGQRCGAIITSPTSVNAFAQAHFAALMSAPTLGQVLAARCLEPEVREPFLERTRDRLVRRHSRMSAAAAHVPGVSVSPSDVGVFAWLRLPHDGHKVAARLADHSVVVVPGLAFGAHWSNHIRVLSDVPETSMTRFVAALRQSVGEGVA